MTHDFKSRNILRVRSVALMTKNVSTMLVNDVNAYISPDRRNAL